MTSIAIGLALFTMPADAGKKSAKSKRLRRIGNPPSARATETSSNCTATSASMETKRRAPSWASPTQKERRWRRTTTGLWRC